MIASKTNLEWYVFTYNSNAKQIEHYNVFLHVSFLKDVKELLRRVGVRHFDEERTADALETFSFLSHNLHLLQTDGVEEFARKAHTQKGD